MIYFFGYAIKEDNPNGVFEYSEAEETQGMRNTYLGYQMLNEQTWAWIDNNKEEYDSLKVQINHKDDGFSFIHEKKIMQFKNMLLKSTIKSK